VILSTTIHVQTHEVALHVLDIFRNEKVSRDASLLPAAVAALEGIVLVGQPSAGLTSRHH